MLYPVEGVQLVPVFVFKVEEAISEPELPYSTEPSVCEVKEFAPLTYKLVIEKCSPINFQHIPPNSFLKKFRLTI